MNVWMNLLSLRPGVSGGVETYCRELLAPLSSIPGLRLTVLCTPALAGHLPRLVNGEVRTPGIPMPGRLARVLYEQTLLGWHARRGGADVLFCPGYLAPVVPALPTVVTIPDTQFRDIPELMPPDQRALYRTVVPMAARQAAAVITISGFSRQQIIKHLHVAPERVHVIHLAARASEISTSEPQTWTGPALPERFILCVASGNPHKNIQRLCRAYMAARAALAEPWPLVLVGRRVPLELNGNPSDATTPGILCLGYLSEAALAAVYQRASAFVFPSLYEGFGLPVIEAMHAGLPVACSQATCLPEVAGGAALLFDPQDESSIAAALVRLVNEPELRAQLSQKGRLNASRYTWPDCARLTAEVFRSVLVASGSLKPGWPLQNHSLTPGTSVKRRSE